MAGVKVKICGITTPDAARAVVAAGADAAGFVFHPPSPRALDIGRAAALAAALSALAPARGLARVGLFVDAPDALIEAAVDACGLDIIQVQGGESPERVAALKARFGLPVWRAVGIATAADLAAAERRWAIADALLLDARAPQGAASPGGNGLRFDWRLLAARPPAMPWILAGGLDPANVAEAVRLTAAAFVDVSSGVESAPGTKDLAKIAAFTQAARRV
jgi:phosphoribosylanthranilate isomerase